MSKKLAAAALALAATAATGAAAQDRNDVLEMRYDGTKKHGVLALVLPTGSERMLLVADNYAKQTPKSDGMITVSDAVEEGLLPDLMAAYLNEELNEIGDLIRDNLSLILGHEFGDVVYNGVQVSFNNGNDEPAAGFSFWNDNDPQKDVTIKYDPNAEMVQPGDWWLPLDTEALTALQNVTKDGLETLAGIQTCYTQNGACPEAARAAVREIGQYIFK